MNAIRLMRSVDVPAVMRIQAECYVQGLHEREAVICERLVCSPDTAWVLDDNGEVTGYLVAYRSRLGKVTPFDAAFEVADESDCLYLHDLALSQRVRGQGGGRRLVLHALAAARDMGLSYSALVSVQDSLAFWEARGYLRVSDLDAVQERALAGYSTISHYMTFRIA